MIIKTVDPFKLSITLLFISISLSIHLIYKTFSTWTASMLIMTFSRGIMILFCYSASVVNLETIKKTPHKIYKISMLTPLTFYLSRQPWFKAELWIKEFTINITRTLTIIILILFIIPIIENCFFPTRPIQSTF